MLFCKKIVITFCLIFIVSFTLSQPAYSRGGGGGGGGCFDGETLILTPEGSKKIKDLASGDTVASYNFDTQHQELSAIANIEVIEAPDYYLINNKIKVTGTHPFYTQHERQIELVEVKNIQLGNFLIDRNNSQIKISSIKHIDKPISVYNLIAVHPHHNFYADGVLVHNKGGGGGGSFGARGGGGGSSANINEKTLPGIFSAFIILSGFFFLIVFLPQIFNFFIFFCKKFTDDLELIEFAKSINTNFKNKYSTLYIEDDQIWQQIEVQEELPESEYQQIITKVELVKQVSVLFSQYQHDWTFKDFQSMTAYVTEPFYSIQKKIAINNFGKNFDIVYNHNLSQIVPIDIEFTEERYFIRLQINASMINFTLSETGYILTGISKPRSFSEYWDIEIKRDNIWSGNLESITKVYLANISQVDPES